MFYNNVRVDSIGPDQLEKMKKAREDFFLLDVRTPSEYAAQAIEGAHLIPLQELGYRINELPKNKDIVVYCRVGNRSAYASALLAQQGFRVKNLEGGIVSWNMAGIASLAKA